MTAEETKTLLETIGAQATEKIKAEMASYEAKMKGIADAAVKQGGGLTEEQFKAYKEAGEASLSEIKEIARKQGVSLAELKGMMGTGAAAGKSIEQVFHEHENDLRKAYNREGNVQFMVTPKEDGSFTMRKFDPTAQVQKAVGPTGTIDGLTSGGTSSISQAFNAASLLRMGGDAPIQGLYRNRQWLFDLVNVTQAGWDMPFAVWFEEQAVQGGATTVLEGAAKPLTQYAYALQSKQYKKKAQLVTFTEEFSLDFPRLQADIMGKGRTDVLNKVNTDVLADITTAATAYNTAALFTNGGTDIVPGANDFDAIAAMAAQVDNATFGALANTAIMSTFKRRRMGILKSDTNEYLNRPEVLNDLAFIGNPDMGADDVVVGDLKQVNLILRGGFIIKVGYNGTDFAENKFSVVMEQYYYDYISSLRAAAIVKGTTFASVKAAIS